jgi:hypothetical protein
MAAAKQQHELGLDRKSLFLSAKCFWRRLDTYLVHGILLALFCPPAYMDAISALQLSAIVNSRQRHLASPHYPPTAAQLPL